MDKEPVTKAPRGRVTRVPVGRRNILTVTGKDPDYEYRIVNDIGNRVETFKEAGYTVVNADEVKIGDKRVDQVTSPGSIAQISVGQGVKAVLLKQRKEWHEEDQKAKQAAIDQTELSMQNQPLDSLNYGKVEITRR